MAPKKITEASKTEEKKEAEDPKKRKVEDKPDESLPKKEAKKDESAKKEVKKEGKKDEEDTAASGEKEKDSLKDARAITKEAIAFNPTDITLNVVPSVGGKLLMSLSEGGMQYLIAGARANVGMTAGRYMYEVKIIEALNPAESSGGQRGRVPMPRQLLRLGFSTAGSALILGDGNDAAFFDSEGNYVSGKNKKPSASQRFTRDQVIGVLLNLDPKSPNANTLSLFREGERISEPQPLPEHLLGKALFPHVSFRSVTLQMAFGPTPSKPLPFKCRTLQGAAQADLVSAPKLEPKGGKYEVMLPVALPDEGTFDWLDLFLENHPEYVELSDRKILEWAASSGLFKPRGGLKSSNDKPEFNFGLPSMDDFSIRRVLSTIVPVVPRHYIIMEVKSNLVKEEREAALARFRAPHFKKVAKVVMGQPSDEFTSTQQERFLKEKQDKSDAEWKAKRAEEERKKQAEQRQKQLAEMRKKADEARKKAAEDAKRKREEELKKKAEEKKAKEEAEKKAKEEAEKKTAEGEAGNKEDTEEAKQETTGVKEETKAEMQVDEPKEEANETAKVEPKEEAGGDEDDKKDEDMEEKEEGPPQVELTEEEKAMWFRPVNAGTTGDLTSLVMSQSFASFTLPEKEEGFDEIQYEWQGAQASSDYLRTWVKQLKLTSRIEDLQPGEWFQEKHGEWLKANLQWQAKHKEYKNSAAKKAKDEANKKKKEEEKEKEEKEENGEEDGKDAEMDEDPLDIFSVEDICDVGSGEPLFANFNFEDWALLQLRVELYFLLTAFQKDVDDDERPGIHETHLAFYYNKYFRKQLNPKYFGVNGNAELCKLVKDTVAISDDTQILTSTLTHESEKVEIFVKLTEENRRERQRRIDAGDETAKLKFSAMALQQQQQAQRPAAATPGRQGGASALGATLRPTGTAAGAWAGYRNAAGAARWPTPQPSAYAARAPGWRK